MRPLRYSINVTLDGCCDHTSVNPSEELHRHHAASLDRYDAMLLGRVTYEMMRDAWRKPESGIWPDWIQDWMVPFAEAMNAAKKYVVSDTLTDLDWNTERVTGDLGPAVQRLKDETGKGLMVGGVTLPCELARLGLLDEFEMVVHPVVAGHGPYLLAGLTDQIELDLVGEKRFSCGALGLTYKAKPS